MANILPALVIVFMLSVTINANSSNQSGNSGMSLLKINILCSPQKICYLCILQTFFKLIIIFIADEAVTNQCIGNIKKGVHNFSLNQIAGLQAALSNLFAIVSKEKAAANNVIYEFYGDYLENIKELGLGSEYMDAQSMTTKASA